MCIIEKRADYDRFANAVINVNSFSKKHLYSKPCLLKMGALVNAEQRADVQEKAVSYPFIVVKTERIEENVVFE